MTTRRSFMTGLLAAGPLLLSRPARAALDCTEGMGTRTCTSGIRSQLLDQRIADDQMHASQWCWAASISMIFQYHGHPVDQVRIVRETFGTIVDMPGQPHDILRATSRQWTDDSGVRFHSQADALSANLLTAAQDLSADQPLIIGALGHAMVLTSMTYTADVYGRFGFDEVVVRDPMPGIGKRRMRPREFQSIQFLARVRVS